MLAEPKRLRQIKCCEGRSDMDIFSDFFGTARSLSQYFVAAPMALHGRLALKPRYETQTATDWNELEQMLHCPGRKPSHSKRQLENVS